jgi:hypothetical protein
MDTCIDERVFGNRLSEGTYSGFKEIAYHFMLEMEIRHLCTTVNGLHFSHKCLIFPGCIHG